jgi:hypothetical protein
MVSEVQLRNDVSAMLQGIAIPDAPVARIRAAMGAMPPGPPVRRRARAWASAAAAAVIVVGVLPAVAPGFTASVQERVLKMLRWSPPNAPVPATLKKVLVGESLDLGDAQHAVDFHVVVPTGLPEGAALVATRVASDGAYSPASHAWAAGAKHIQFSYRRGDGGTFDLTAASSSTLAEPPSRYMVEERGTDKDGNTILVKRERYVWRNGDQVTTAIVSDNLSAAEIATIRDAMHGVPIATVWPPKPRGGAALRLHP